MRYLIATVLTLGAAALSAGNRLAIPAARGSANDGIVISRIVGRRNVIVARSGPDGARYSLETANGKTIVPAATLKDLAATKPELSKTVEGDWAATDEDPVVP